MTSVPSAGGTQEAWRAAGSWWLLVSGLRGVGVACGQQGLSLKGPAFNSQRGVGSPHVSSASNSGHPPFPRAVTSQGWKVRWLPAGQSSESPSTKHPSYSAPDPAFYAGVLGLLYPGGAERGGHGPSESTEAASSLSLSRLFSGVTTLWPPQEFPSPGHCPYAVHDCGTSLGLEDATDTSALGSGWPSRQPPGQSWGPDPVRCPRGSSPLCLPGVS